MTNPSINRAMAAMQLAKEQKQKQQAEQGSTQVSSPSPKTELKTELKPAYHQNINPANPTTTKNVANPINHPSNSATNIATKPSFVRVDISVAGTPHRISCPTDDVANLKKHSDQLNQNLREIRRQVGGKSPNNEELLVLHCLELYDDIQSLKTKLQDHHIEQERSHALIDKLIKDTKAILG